MTRSASPLAKRRGILLHGEAGCGKTLAVRALAGACCNDAGQHPLASSSCNAVGVDALCLLRNRNPLRTCKFLLYRHRASGGPVRPQGGGLPRQVLWRRRAHAAPAVRRGEITSALARHLHTNMGQHTHWCPGGTMVVAVNNCRTQMFQCITQARLVALAA